MLGLERSAVSHPIDEVSEKDLELAKKVMRETPFVGDPDTFSKDSIGEGFVKRIAQALSTQRREIEAEGDRLAEKSRIAWMWADCGHTDELKKIAPLLKEALSHWEAFKRGGDGT